MKQGTRLLIVLLLISGVLFSIIGCNNKKAKSYYNAAVDILATTPNNLSTEDFNRVLDFLDKSIENDNSMWQAYHQELYLYKEHKDYENMIRVYNKWSANGNVMNSVQQFGLACTCYCANDKNTALNMFQNIYNDNKDFLDEDKFKKKSEYTYIVTTLSGIIIGKINDIVQNDDFSSQQEGITKRETNNDFDKEMILNDLFYNFHKRYKDNPDDILSCYAGF